MAKRLVFKKKKKTIPAHSKKQLFRLMNGNKMAIKKSKLKFV
jgi:hypothetical protein